MKREMETNKEKKMQDRGEELLCYRLQEMRERERWKIGIYFNKDTLWSVGRPTGTSTTKKYIHTLATQSKIAQMFTVPFMVKIKCN